MAPSFSPKVPTTEYLAGCTIIQIMGEVGLKLINVLIDILKSIELDRSGLSQKNADLLVQLSQTTLEL